MEPQPYSPGVKKCQENHQFSPIMRGHRTHGLGPCPGQTRVTNSQLPMRAGWRNAPLEIWYLAEAICMKRGIALQIKLDSMFDN